MTVSALSLSAEPSRGAVPRGRGEQHDKEGAGTGLGRQHLPSLAHPSCEIASDAPRTNERSGTLLA